LGEFARRLSSLYLLEDVAFDQIALETVALDVPSYKPKTLLWDAGVNYFSASADLRWWQDHRIPGGIALSVNSVGHMVKSARVRKTLKAVADDLGLPADEDLSTDLSRVDSLGKALEVAMQTISLASEGPSGKATQLLPLPSSSAQKRCPITLRPPLSRFDFTKYVGYYHTDVTLPSVYFRPDVERPAEVELQELDLTYLFDKSLDNPSFRRMGEGRRIRSAGLEENPREGRCQKRRKAKPDELSRYEDSPSIRLPDRR
jgi:hypothetical protein